MERHDKLISGQPEQERIEYQEQKVVYDPFEVFKPSKTFLKEVIKQLKQRSYEIIKKKRQPEYQIVRWNLDQQQQRILQLIRLYERRLKTDRAEGYITELEIGYAKAVPISHFFNGKLIKSASRLRGVCPFHQEKTPSFVIYPTNTWHCFGCQESGDAITFVQKTHNLKFIEAVKFLIQK